MGEGCLLRTKDPFLDLSNWGASGREREGHIQGTTAHPWGHSLDKGTRGLLDLLLVGRPRTVAEVLPEGFVTESSEGPVMR